MTKTTFRVACYSVLAVIAASATGCSVTQSGAPADDSCPLNRCYNISELDFNSVAVGSPRNMEIIFKAETRVAQVTVTAPDGTATDTFRASTKVITSSSGQQDKVILTFTPKSLGPYSAVLKVVFLTPGGDSGTECSCTYTLKGEGAEAKVDVCLLDPFDDGVLVKMCPQGASECAGEEKVDACQSNCTGDDKDCLLADFGSIKPGAEESRKVVIRNGGGIDLTISSTRIFQCPPGTDNLEECTWNNMAAARSFSVIDPPGGFTQSKVDPYSEKIMTVRYLPTAGGYDRGAILVESTDEKAEQINVYLKGTSAAPSN